MGTIILTSTGLSNSNVAKKFFDLIGNDKPKNSVAIITTAAEGKENNKYSLLAKKQFLYAGFKDVEFVDLEAQSISLDKYNVIYVCGGNTFKLLKFAKEKSFSENIKQLLDRDGFYIGVSAGSIIMSPSIDIANEIEPDSNDANITDFDSFGIIPFHIMPHYYPDIEDEVKKFENRHSVEVKRLTNDQALFVKNSTIELVEQLKEMNRAI